MPVAGATQLTVANIFSGGCRRVSSVVPSLVILALILGMAPLLVPVPLAALAAILMRIGFSIVDWRLLACLHRIAPGHVVVMLATLGLTVLVDLNTAVAIGLIVAGLVRARQLEYLELDNVISLPVLDRSFYAGYPGMAEVDPHSARVGLVVLRGRLTVAPAGSWSRSSASTSGTTQWSSSIFPTPPTLAIPPPRSSINSSTRPRRRKPRSC